MHDSQLKFAARRDLAGFVMILVIFALGAVLLLRHDLIPWPMIDKIGWLFVVLGVLALWDWAICSYEIVQEQLIVRHAWSTQTVMLNNIEEFQQRFGRLQLKCHGRPGSGWLTVMPIDDAAFLRRLRQKCPWLRHQLPRR